MLLYSRRRAVCTAAEVAPAGHRARDLLGEGAECAEVGISIYDDDGRYVAVNVRGSELLGYDRAEVLSRDVADFTDGGIDRSLHLSSKRREGVRVVERKDGTTVPVAFVVVPTPIANIGFSMAFFWELAPDDPRAVS